MVLGATPEEQQRIANLLNYKLGSFPFTYLGIPIGDLALVASHWEPLGLKDGKVFVLCGEIDSHKRLPF
jgi:hypothetical protein